MLLSQVKSRAFVAPAQYTKQAILVSGRRQQGLVLVVLLTLSISVYLNSLYGGFLLDDEMLIQDAVAIRSFDVDLITYRLIRTLSYAIDYFFWGLNPLGYHLSNVFYNSLTVLVVFFLTRRLTGAFYVSLFTAVLFAVHPIHTEAVSYLSGRRDILSGLFYFMGFLFYLRASQGGNGWTYLGVLICYLAGVLSKEMAITLPLTILAYEVSLYVEEKQTGGQSVVFLLGHAVRDTLKRFQWVILPLALFVFVYLYLVLFVQGASSLVNAERFVWWGGTPIANMTTVCRVVVAYIHKLFFPVVLHVDYHQFPFSRSFMDHRFLAAALTILGVITFSVGILRKNRLLAFAIWWFFLTLLPVMQIIPHHILMAEHYLYLPSYGFCLGISLLVCHVLRERHLRIPILICLAFLVTVFSIRTVDRNQDWQDTVTLMKDGLKHNATNPLYHFFLGRIYALNKLLVSAERELDMSIGPRHDNANVHAVKALVAFQQGRYEEGLYETDEALRRQKNNQMALYNGGYYAIKMGDYTTALEYFLKVKPDYEYGNALVKIAFLYAENNELEKAESTLLDLLKLFPNSAAAYLGLANIYTKALRFDDALEQYNRLLQGREAIELAQSLERAGIGVVKIEESLKYVEELKRRYDSAIEDVRRRNTARGHYILGKICMEIGNYERAEEELENAKDSMASELVLAQVYVLAGNDQKAEKLFQLLTTARGDPSPDVLVGAGEYYARTLRFKQSRELFERAMEKAPNNEGIEILFNWSRQLEARQQYSFALHQAGNSVEAALTKSEVYAAVGQYDKAVELLADLPTKGEERILKRLGSLYEMMGYPYWAKTLQTYRQLTSLNEQDAEVWKRLGSFYYTVIQDYESALRCFQRSLIVDPHQDEAEKIQRTVEMLDHYVRQYQWQ